MANVQYELKDHQWEQIKGLFTPARTGRPGKDNRMMFNASEGTNMENLYLDSTSIKAYH